MLHSRSISRLVATDPADGNPPDPALFQERGSMHHPMNGLRLVATLLIAAFVIVASAGCGSSSQDASTVLRQTFSGEHKVDSGTLEFNLTVQPSGSSTLKGPITLSFGGPFQSLGKGRLPESDFNVSIGAMGESGTIGILSTGTNGYVTFQGASYELPKADFEKLESSFSQLSSTPGASAGSGVLGRLGIQPLQWLVDPKVVGTDVVGGASTTHVHAGINVPVLLNDFNTFLERASSLGISGSSSLPHGISQASRNEIASKVKNPSVDVWTGNADRTIRKLLINLTLPISGQASSLLGGLQSAGITLSLAYSELNQPQTITPPTTVLPYSQFQTKLRALLQGVESGVSGSLLGSSTGSGTGTTGGGASSASGYQAYSTCVEQAGGSIAKMQRCAPLLSSK
jgi:hypothetical protein